MKQARRGVSLKWRIGGAFVGVVSLLGLFVIATVYQLTGQALRWQLDRRALVIAANLSDAAAGPLLVRNRLELHALVTKYTLLEGVAYTFIEDGNGEIAAHSLGIFPQELREPLNLDARLQRHRRELRWHGRLVHETRVPVLQGQAGTVRVGIWGDVVEGEIRRTLLPLIGVIAVVVFVGALVSALLASWIIRPIVRLTQIADKISMGNLETPVRVRSRDEIGDLARSLERIRASLKAATARLSHR